MCHKLNLKENEINLRQRRRQRYANVSTYVILKQFFFLHEIALNELKPLKYIHYKETVALNDLKSPYVHDTSLNSSKLDISKCERMGKSCRCFIAEILPIHILT